MIESLFETMLKNALVESVLEEYAEIIIRKKGLHDKEKSIFDCGENAHNLEMSKNVEK